MREEDKSDDVKQKNELEPLDHLSAQTDALTTVKWCQIKEAVMPGCMQHGTEHRSTAVTGKSTSWWNKGVGSATESFGKPHPGFGDRAEPPLHAKCTVVICSVSIKISQDAYFELNVQKIR